MQFEWDGSKNKLNQQKHGVAFEVAQNAFDDLLQLSNKKPDGINFGFEVLSSNEGDPIIVMGSI
ncbi:MAG: hypothetical protein CTY16_18695 [Methylobacter sp.]|nr:MAG: hypothetical protein CTY16_18695 [Methylobacter sp.]